MTCLHSIWGIGPITPQHTNYRARYVCARDLLLLVLPGLRAAGACPWVLGQFRRSIRSIGMDNLERHRTYT